MGPYLSYVATNDVDGSARETVRPTGTSSAAASYKPEPQYFLPFTCFSRCASFSAQVSSSLHSAWTLSWNPAWPGSSSRDLKSASVGMSTPGMWTSVYSGMKDDSYRCWNVVLMCYASVWTAAVCMVLLRLGVLACYSTTIPDLPPDLREGFLSQLNQCDNPTVKKVEPLGRVVLAPPTAYVLNHSVPLLKVKQDIARSVMSDYNGTQPLQKLGHSVTALSVSQVSMIPWDAFKELQNNFSMQWTQGQMHALVKKKLGEMKVTVPEPPESCPNGFLLTARCVSLSARTSPTRSWWSSSRLSEVCPTVCSNISKPTRSWMTWRRWRPFPSEWGRLSWRPCCRGSVIGEVDHLHHVTRIWRTDVWEA